MMARIAAAFSRYLAACVCLAAGLYGPHALFAQQPYQFGLRFQPINFQQQSFPGIQFRQQTFEPIITQPIQFQAITFPSINSPYGPIQRDDAGDDAGNDVRLGVDWRRQRLQERARYDVRPPERINDFAATAADANPRAGVMWAPDAQSMARRLAQKERREHSRRQQEIPNGQTADRGRYLANRQRQTVYNLRDDDSPHRVRFAKKSAAADEARLTARTLPAGHSAALLR